ncbi:DNA-protecting protein DprA [Permianibacter sp. IMCC34836]|uniref:DNA-processing protein DprA n=1 Tax=Permianibacter fluminis TaxID=2738515 RepID=UPI001553251A|nr:DNA-processing protein DprA [Permianibacter fluminis]NQD36070.1 DNA-protecting protein DprA [Permianibacter fluminis]
MTAVTTDRLQLWLELALLAQYDGKIFQSAHGLPDEPFALRNRLPALTAELAARVDAALAWQTAERHLICPDDPRYPALLRDLPDPPLLLYVLGNAELLADPQLAIVGSRNPTPPGRDNAVAFAKALAESGLTITSGLALGIDAAAHEGALLGKGPTIAVAGTGVDRVYPASHRELAHRIVAGGGALISEFALGTPPLKHQFPQRNRIISGLSLGTLVVEAALSSGSLITARQALEQGREVFAIPGSIHNPMAKGCHQLIRQGAKLVETAKDVLEELGALIPLTLTSPTSAGAEAASTVNPIDRDGLDAEQLQLLAEMGFDPVSPDELIARTGFGADVVAGMLLTLELNNVIAAVPGGYLRRR